MSINVLQSCQIYVQRERPQVMQLEQQLDTRRMDVYRIQRDYRISLAEKDSKIVALEGQLAEIVPSSVNLKQVRELHIANAQLSGSLEQERKLVLSQKEKAERLQLRVEELEMEVRVPNLLTAACNFVHTVA